MTRFNAYSALLPKTLLATHSQLAYSGSDGEEAAKSLCFDRGQLLGLAPLPIEPRRSRRGRLHQASRRRTRPFRSLARTRFLRRAKNPPARARFEPHLPGLQRAPRHQRRIGRVNPGRATLLNCRSCLDAGGPATIDAGHARSKSHGGRNQIASGKSSTPHGNGPAGRNAH